MEQTKYLHHKVTRADISRAMAQFDREVRSDFHHLWRKHVFYHDGRPYPTKRIVRLAIREPVNGGGIPFNRVLTDLGFTVVSFTGSQPPPDFALPEEVTGSLTLVEGAVRTITINAYERNPEARRQCITEHGTRCAVCEFAFGDYYGPVADGYIHVHHLQPLSEIGHEYVVDPVADLRPVCPNCHAVIHRRTPPYSIEEVRDLIRQHGRR